MKRTMLAVVLCSSLAFGGEPADAPKAVVLTPAEAEAHAARVLTCEADLADCKADGKVSPLWLTVGIGAGVLTGIGIGFAVGFAAAKR